MGDGYESRRASKSHIAEKKPHELLVQIGGALTILLTVATFLLPLNWSNPTFSQSSTTILITNVVLGGALVICGAILRKSLMNGAIVACVVGVILIVFGDKPGLIGGIVGIIGAIVAIASPYLPAPRHHRGD